MWAVARRLRLALSSAHTWSCVCISHSIGRHTDRLLDGASSLVVAVEAFAALATEPDETVSASSSQLRTLTSLIWRSTVATGGVTDLVLIVGSSQFGTSLAARSSDQDDRAVLLAAGAHATAKQMTTLRRPRLPGAR